MGAIEILPFILFIVVIATAIAERLRIPYPLLLVIAGLIVGYIPGIPNWHPPNDLVLPLFLPPILFAAARSISWQDIKDNASTIISLSLLLVIVTAFALGWLLIQFVPGMPFGVALVLGAIIAPTDATAATGVLTKMHARASIVRTLEVESLFNDAVSIVLYKTALVFVMIGTFNFGVLTVRAALSGAAGVVIGLLFSYFTSLIVEQFLKRSENDLPIIMSLILAYVSYLFAHSIGASGVLATVAAGLYHKKTERVVEASIRLSEKTVWDTLLFFLNGIIFISIGIQFPTYLQKVSYLPTSDIVWFSVITIIGLLLLRIIWVAVSLAIGDGFLHMIKHWDNSIVPTWKRIIIISWSGMRGLVSLALAVALPLTLNNGFPFPYLNLIIFLTIITILFTLLAQGLTLPWVIKWLGLSKESSKEIRQMARIYDTLTKKAVANMDHAFGKKDRYSQGAKKLVSNYYANRLLHHSVRSETAESARHEVILEAEKCLARILQYERKVLTRMLEEGKISEEIYLKILRKLDRDEVGFASYR